MLVDLMTSDPTGGRAARRGGFTGLFSGRRARRPGGRLDRRAAPGVEAVESRVSLSGFTSLRPGLVYSYGDPNERSPGLVYSVEDPNTRPGLVRSYEDPNLRTPGPIRAFSPQPDPPTLSARIIAIL